MGAEVNRYTRLLPVHVCQAVIERFESPDVTPMGDGPAKKATASLLASYPYAFNAKDGNEIDKLAYMRQVQNVFAAFPEWAAAVVIDPVKGLPSKDTKFLPAAGAVSEALKAAIAAKRAYAVIAKRHLAEAVRRDEEEARDAQIEAERNGLTDEQRQERIGSVLGKMQHVPHADPPRQEKRMTYAEMEADLAAIKARATPERIAEVEAMIENGIPFQ